MFTQDETKEIINLYTNSFLSLNELSKYFNCSTYLIKKVLLLNDIRIRTRAEQTRCSNMKRALTCNNQYFSKIDSINKAWLLGFLMSDGTVRKERNEIKIGLSSIDREILEKIKEELKISRPILDYETNNGFNISQLAWTSFQQKQDLAFYGIVPNKTYLENHLPNFDKKYKLAYILGFLDGDGSISIDKENHLRIRFFSYRIELLEDIKNFLEETFNATSSLSKSNKRQFYELSFSTKYASNILKEMYDLNSLRLNRKYQKYLEWKTHETLTS